MERSPQPERLSIKFIRKALKHFKENESFIPPAHEECYGPRELFDQAVTEFDKQSEVRKRKVHSGDELVILESNKERFRELILARLGDRTWIKAAEAGPIDHVFANDEEGRFIGPSLP